MKKIITGVGMIVFVGAIIAGATGAFFSDTETSTGNVFTAGALDLKIDSVAHYNGMVCAAVGETYVWIPEANVTLDEFNQPIVGEAMDTQLEWDAYNTANPLQYPEAGTACTGTWPLADLGPNEVGVGTFFNFDDIKPGDEGENTISVHVNNNDAWMCASIDNVDGADLAESATEPEDAAEDALGDIDHADDLAASELDENLNFFAWVDDGDNVFEAEEQPLGQTTASELASETWALADSTTGDGPIQGDVTQYIGLYWCAGDLTVDGTTLSCNGEAMGNEAQTDSWSADLSFYIEQSRNNEEFVCNRETQPETGAITVDKSIAFSNPALSDVDVTDFTYTLTGPGGEQIVLDEVKTTGLPAGAYTVSETYIGDEVGLQVDAVFSGACADDGDTGSLVLAAGDDVTCTVTNNLSLVN